MMIRTPRFRVGQRIVVASPDGMSVRRGWPAGRYGTVREVCKVGWGFSYYLEEAYMGVDTDRMFILFHEEELEALP